MRALVIAVKDWMQLARDRKTALFMLLMPLVFTGALARVFDAPQRPPELAWLNLDGASPESRALEEQLRQQGQVVLVPVPDEATLTSHVRDGSQLAGLLLPPGFAASLREDAPPLQATLVLDDGAPAAHELRLVVQGALRRVVGAAAMARHAGAAPGPAWDDAMALGLGELGAALEGVVVEREQPGTAAGFSQTSPGMMVQFGIFGLMGAAMILVTERKSRVLDRLRSTAVPPRTILLGHLLAMFVVVLVQQLVLAVAAQLLFGVPWAREPLAILLVMAAFASWIAAMGLCIGVWAVKEEQVILITMVAMFVFCALGGAWFPLEGTGPVFSRVGHLTPGAWAMDGFQNILLRGQGITSVFAPCAVLCGHAAAFLALAVWRFKRI